MVDCLVISHVVVEGGLVSGDKWEKEIIVEFVRILLHAIYLCARVMDIFASCLLFI